MNKMLKWCWWPFSLMEGDQMNTWRSWWKYEKVGGYVEYDYLSSFSEGILTFAQIGSSNTLICVLNSMG
jgi:hypothetical protein